jgi:hypothetical protein
VEKWRQVLGVGAPPPTHTKKELAFRDENKNRCDHFSAQNVYLYPHKKSKSAIFGKNIATIIT